VVTMTTQKARSAKNPPPFATPLADDFLWRLRAILADTTEPDAVIAALQAEWGGDRPYIRRQGEAARHERSLRDRAIVRDHQRGESSALIARRYGITPQRVGQILRMGESVLS